MLITVGGKVTIFKIYFIDIYENLSTFNSQRDYPQLVYLSPTDVFN